MGVIEKRVKKRARKANIRGALLATIAVAGTLAVALAAPNTLKLLKYGPGVRSQYHSRIRRSLTRLAEEGYIAYSKGGRGARVELTPKGELLLIKLSSGTARLKRPSQWDGRWRIVTFDIPERRKRARDHLRLMLTSLGFRKWQSSVWIYPYDCEDVLVLIREDPYLQKEVAYIVAEEIENDHTWRRKFGLPLR